MSKTYAVIENGTVVNVVLWDGESEWSPDNGVAIPAADGVGIGWLYADGEFSAPPVPPPTEEQLEAEQEAKKAANAATKDRLMKEANQRISVLQDAVDMEFATDEEAAALPLWKKYRVLLSRVDVTTGEKIEWPEKP